MNRINSKILTAARAGVQVAAPPLAFLAAYLLLIATVDALGIDVSGDALLGHARTLLDRQGLWIVFAAAAAEGLILAGIYAPGSVVILISLTAGRGSPLSAFKVLAVASAGWFVATHINYWLGRLRLAACEGSNGFVSGWSKLLLFSAFVTPASAALGSVLAGARRLPYSQFVIMTAAGVSASNAVFGFLAYRFAAGLIEKAGTNRDIILVILGAWTVIAFAMGTRRQKRCNEESMSKRKWGDKS